MNFILLQIILINLKQISAKFQTFGEKIFKFMQNYVNLCKFLEKSLNALNFKFILIILYEFMSN